MTCKIELTATVSVRDQPRAVQQAIRGPFSLLKWLYCWLWGHGSALKHDFCLIILLTDLYNMSLWDCGIKVNPLSLSELSVWVWYVTFTYFPFYLPLSSTDASLFCFTVITGQRRTATHRWPPRLQQSHWTAESAATWWPAPFRSPLMLSISAAAHRPSRTQILLRSQPELENPQHNQTGNSVMMKQG